LCGHAGLAGPGINAQDLSIARNLGILSQIRGRDGAGVFQISSARRNQKFNNSFIYKTSENFSTMLDEIDWDKAYKDVLNNVSCDIIMMHVRAATRGRICSANSHPFIVERFVGAHNGTLKDQKYQDKDKTDSELMFRDMNNRGIIPVISELNDDSAYAVVIYDRTDGALYFGRNEKRTLALAFLEDRNVMYWASEKEMLKFVLNRHGVNAKYFNLLPHKLLKVVPSEISCKKAALDCMKVTHLFKPELEKKEEKKDEAPFKPTSVPQVKSKEDQHAFGWTAPEYSYPLKQEKITPANKNNVVDFPKSQENGKIKSFFSKCACGAKTMNLIETNYSRRGLKGYPRWDSSMQKHYCEECDPLNVLKENA